MNYWLSHYELIKKARGGMQPDATTVNEIRDACQKHEFRTASLHAMRPATSF